MPSLQCPLSLSAVYRTRVSIVQLLPMMLSHVPLTTLLSVLSLYAFGTALVTRSLPYLYDTCQCICILARRVSIRSPQFSATVAFSTYSHRRVTMSVSGHGSAASAQSTDILNESCTDSDSIKDFLEQIR
ncbi:hypothetical protein L226DRAFT_270565 [Lentinus tigrinus ALCF2SS1-7]|uniref:uncharacterized protein n=1 Tax=Lentinus tigrinus ALCF2SS1-7 TaxID=1328758 RepID=UPI001165EB9D|nr:hypothetical protein L226DRAFT_270565 [Lentinus tigrinus ALCF2SS1-7]